MAKFTAGVDLNIRLPNGEELIGVAGTTHRFSDALVDEFVRDLVPLIPGFAWVNQDETSAIANGASVSVAAETTYGISTSAGTAASYSRGDHTHGSPSLATTAASTLAIGNSASSGTASLPARSDHEHGLPAFGGVTAAITYGISSSNGTATTPARSDHVHGTVPDPTTSGAGFTIASGNLSVTAGNIVLASSSQALVLPGLLRFGGTAFPASPSTNDLFYRTDLSMEFFYNGTRWLSTQLFVFDFPYNLNGTSVSATNEFLGMVPITLHGGSDLWIERTDFSIYVNTGTLSGSNYWTFEVLGGVILTDGITWNSKHSATLNSGTATTNEVFVVSNTTPALLNNGTTHSLLRFRATESGTPPTVLPSARTQYRVVAT